MNIFRPNTAPDRAQHRRHRHEQDLDPIIRDQLRVSLNVQECTGGEDVVDPTTEPVPEGIHALQLPFEVT